MTRNQKHHLLRGTAILTGLPITTREIENTLHPYLYTLLRKSNHNNTSEGHQKIRDLSAILYSMVAPSGGIEKNLNMHAQLQTVIYISL